MIQKGGGNPLLNGLYPKTEANIGVRKVRELSFVKLPEMY